MISVDQCPLCGGDASKPFYKFGAPDRVSVFNRICTHCGLIRQSPRMDAAELSAYYARYMTETQPSIADIPPSFEEHISAIGRLRLSHLRPFLQPGMRVLDIGCSFGALMAVLRDESGIALDVVGVNPEDSLAEFGRRRWGLDIRTGMFEEMDFPEESFDLVILDNVIEHFDDPAASVAAINRLTKPGGLFAIVTNNAGKPHGLYWQNFFPDHTVTFTPETLTALLGMQGYDVRTMDDHGHVTWKGYHYPYLTCVARKAALPGERALQIPQGHARFMRRFVRDYQKRSMAEQGLAKRLYEWSLSPSKAVRRAAQTVKTVSARLGADVHFEMPSHTLPPDEYRRRWVFAAFCRTYADGAAAIDLHQRMRLNADFYLFRSTESGGWNAAVSPNGDKPDFPCADTALAWASNHPGPAHMTISVMLDSSDPPPADWDDAPTQALRGGEQPLARQSGGSRLDIVFGTPPASVWEQAS